MKQSLTEKPVQMLRSLSGSEVRLYGLSTEWMKRNRFLSDLFANYAPQNWKFLSRIGDAAYTRPCPSLGCLDEIYETHGISATWVKVQVSAMFVSSTSEDEQTSYSISVFSDNFASVAAQYKLTELMLFFSRYAAGMYDDSYTSFSARRIGIAFHKEFLPQRSLALSRIERERPPAPEPVFNVSRNQYDAAKAYETALLIRRDSRRLRLELGITGGVGINGQAVSRLPRDKIHLIHEYKQRGDIRVINISEIKPISCDLSKGNNEDDKL